MRTSISLKLTMLAMLGICSVSLTSAILGQSATSTSQGKVAQDGPKGAAVPIENLLGARFFLTKMDVAANGSSVFVSSAATMMDKRSGISYVWELVTKDASGGAVLTRHLYAEQQFKMPLEQNLSPTFDEKLTLLPGTYQVRLRLYEVPDNFNLDALNNEETARAQIALGKTKSVTVSG